MSKPNLTGARDNAKNGADLKNLEAEAVLRATERHQRWVQDAGRFHTKLLFCVWLLPVMGFGGALLAAVFREPSAVLLVTALILLALILLTGAYVFQEVARVHKRIDAILKLLEERERDRE